MSPHAYELGIASYWIMHNRTDVLKEKFALPYNLESTVILVMGYPVEDSKPDPAHKRSKPEADIMQWD